MTASTKFKVLVYKRGGYFYAFAAEYGTVIGEKRENAELQEPLRLQSFMARVKQLLLRFREPVTEVRVEEVELP